MVPDKEEFHGGPLILPFFVQKENEERRADGGGDDADGKLRREEEGPGQEVGEDQEDAAGEGREPEEVSMVRPDEDARSRGG